MPKWNLTMEILLSKSCLKIPPYPMFEASVSIMGKASR